MKKKTSKLQKEHGGASHGAAGIGLETVSQAPHEKVLESYDEPDQKRKKKDVDALQKFEDYMADATSTSDWATRLATIITKSDRNDTGVLNREGEIPGVPEVHDDLEWDKKKNPDHKTTMAMVSNTSNTYHASSGLEKGFGDPAQDDELASEGDRDMISGWDEKRRKRTNNAGGPLPNTSSMKMLNKKDGLYDNIHAKRERGERMRSEGDAEAPTDKDFRDAEKTATKALIKTHLTGEEPTEFYKPLTQEHAKIIRRPLSVVTKSADDYYVLAPPDPLAISVFYEVENLKSTQEQYSDKDKELLTEQVNAADKDLFKLFFEYGKNNGLNIDTLKNCESELEEILKDVNSIVMTKKYYFNFPRPWQYQMHDPTIMTSAIRPSIDAPAYPSGHSTQAVVISAVLGNTFPNHRENFAKIAESIGINRVKAGWHFLMDHIAGKKLGIAIAKDLPAPNTLIPLAKALPHYNNPGVVTGEDIDKKQKQGYTEKDPDHPFLVEFKKLEKEARSYHPTIDEEAKRVDEMDLDGAKNPPEQNSERAILGQ